MSVPIENFMAFDKELSAEEVTINHTSHTSTGEWVHIVCNYNRNGMTTTVYKNGILQSQETDCADIVIKDEGYAISFWEEAA